MQRCCGTGCTGSTSHSLQAGDFRAGLLRPSTLCNSCRHSHRTPNHQSASCKAADRTTLVAAGTDQAARWQELSVAKAMDSRTAMGSDPASATAAGVVGSKLRTVSASQSFSPAPAAPAVDRKALLRAALDLKTRGWTVVDAVLPEEECRRYVDRVWDWLEGLGTGIRKDDPATWGEARWPPAFNASGIVNSLEVGHQDFVWQIRSDPRIVQWFEAIWGTNELLTSFDSINVMRPPEATLQKKQNGAYITDSWWHTDQAPSKSGLHCIQGFVCLSDLGHDAGALEVKDRSHLEHEAFWAAQPGTAQEKAAIGDFYVMRSASEAAYWEVFPTLRVTGHPPGSLVLWDSRTIHQNSPPRDGSLWRFAVYTCYQPRAFASAEALEKKKQAYNEYKMTTHWPAENITVWDEDQPTTGVTGVGNGIVPKYKILRTREQVETDDMRRLGGALPYEPAVVRKTRGLLELSEAELRQLLAAHVSGPTVEQSVAEVVGVASSRGAGKTAAAGYRMQAVPCTERNGNSIGVEQAAAGMQSVRIS